MAQTQQELEFNALITATKNVANKEIGKSSSYLEDMADDLGVNGQFQNYLNQPGRKTPFNQVVQLLTFWKDPLTNKKDLQGQLIERLKNTQRHQLEGTYQTLFDALDVPKGPTPPAPIPAPPAPKPDEPQQGGRRKALVVGIDYLAATKGDVKLMKDALESVGFHVTPKHGKFTKDQLTELVKKFADSLQPGDEALFYFTGHGCSIDGYTFLKPYDAQPGNTAEEMAKYRYNVAHVNNLLIDRVKDSYKLIILDCCRDRNFDLYRKDDYIEVIKRYKEVQKTSSNMIYMYATNDDNESRSGETSRYTRTLAPLIKTGANVMEIQNEIDATATTEQWLQKPTITAQNSLFKF